MLCFFLAFTSAFQHAIASASVGNVIAGTYDILICKTKCSFAESKDAIVKGQMVLFADKLEKADLDRFDQNRFSYHFNEAINGCFTLEKVGQGDIYAGIEKVGLTSWSQKGNRYLFSLYHSPDAGYGVSVEWSMTGLSGTGQSWGAGVAAPQQPTQEFVIARRKGDANISNCTFRTPEEAEFRRLLADPPREKMLAIRDAYRKTLFANLRASDSPRDWAMAGWLDGSEEGIAQILRARRAAPEDGLIQWIAVHRVRSSMAAVSQSAYELRNAVVDDSALAQLQRKEPDNATWWLMSLRAAVNKSDDAAIETALTHLVASTRCDDHAADLFKAQIDVFRRFPLPDEYFALVKKLDPGWQVQPAFTKEIAPYYQNSYPFASIGTNNLFFMSSDGAGLGELFAVCARGERAPARLQSCTAIGRLLADKPTRERAREAGSMLLSEIRSFNEEDIERARTETWIAMRYRDTDPTGKDKPHIAEEMAFAKDWMESGSEFEAMHRALARAGKPLQPPADWSLNKALYKNFEEARVQKSAASAR